MLVSPRLRVCLFYDNSLQNFTLNILWCLFRLKRQHGTAGRCSCITVKTHKCTRHVIYLNFLTDICVRRSVELSIRFAKNEQFWNRQIYNLNVKVK